MQIILAIGILGVCLFVTLLADHVGNRQRERRQGPVDYTEKQKVVLTASMLLGEGSPIICSCCRGRGSSNGVFGGWSRCGQCSGTGYDYIGPKTIQYLAELIKDK